MMARQRNVSPRDRVCYPINNRVSFPLNQYTA